MTMTDETRKIKGDLEAHINKGMDHLEQELAKIRAGKANPHVLDGVHVDYYGTNTPLNQVSSVNTPDAKTIVIQPWEKNMLQPIEKAIHAANLGFNPQNDGTLIRINVPPLTEERRKDLVKLTRTEGEHAKVGIRNMRRDAMEAIKKQQKNGLSEDLAKDAEAEIQELVNASIKKVDQHLDAKEKEIMTI